MSVESVTARINQILQMQQQLFDPQSAASTGTSAVAGAGTASSNAAPASSSTGSLTFSQMLASAQAGSGTTPVSGAAALPTGDATSKVQQMVSMANSLVGKPYGWSPQSGYDCSGFVSAVLHAGGYLSAPADTTSMPNQPGIETGPGQYVTIYDRAQPGENGHVIIKINGQFYESGGETGAWGGGGGVEKIGTPSASYLASFPNVLHPAGL
jgi:cell wall-associated NlpC family hydrolase